ncbi:MAG: UvrD-helicase domain-containing protein [Bacilli bacterium]|nr:UvrD-helicase domain-containing protein [Bacilli bacterium]
MNNLLSSSNQDLKKHILNFLNQDKYLSKKELDKLIAKHFICDEDAIDELFFQVNKHNQYYINRKLLEEKNYLDNMFLKVDKKINLDQEQRIAILTDEDYAMIIAGAGSGKTTTMAAKVKYLVEKQKINPADIMVISYTNKAVNELDTLINQKFKLNVKVITFHSFGYEILNSSQDKKLKVESNGYHIVANYFDKELGNDNEKLKDFIQFFIYYFDIPTSALKFKSLNEYHKHKKRNDYETLKSRLESYNSKTIHDRQDNKYTINNEFLRSSEEVMIANFLFMNGIEYDYEKVYAPLSKTKIYLPDFTIYYGEKIYFLEHYGISEDGTKSIFTKRDQYRYKRNISEKRKIHNKFNTTLIETYSGTDNLLDTLKQKLEKLGIVLKPKSEYEIFSALSKTDKDTYYQRFIVFCLDFIKGFKTKGYNQDSFKKLKDLSDDKRTIRFLDFMEKLYYYYQRELKIRSSIDFEDMINDAYSLLSEANNKQIKLPYKYIIIDEYQDISMQRFNLTKKVSEISGAKVIAVGDDWQAVFAFAGSDVTLFTKFKELMGYGKELQITNTYRNSQELIDIAGKFVMQNRWQIKKQLKSQKRLPNPVNIVTYDNDYKINYHKALAVEQCLIDIYHEYGEHQRILLIGRYGFDKYHLTNNEFFIEYEQDKIRAVNIPELDITYLTAHSSKGLGYDNVIIINGEEGTYGFPSQLKDDPILDLIKIKDDTFAYSEERRLFYVALTRTKNKVYIVAPLSNPSSFIKEIRNYQNVKVIGDNNFKKDSDICPICGFPLVKRQSLINNLYVCSNDKELCDFMTNNLKYKQRIKICPKCKEGYEVVKYSKKNRQYFIGCSNYQKTGCDYTRKL